MVNMKNLLCVLPVAAAFVQPNSASLTRVAGTTIVSSAWPSSILLSEGESPINELVKVAVSDAVSDTTAAMSDGASGGGSLLNQLGEGVGALLAGLTGVIFLLYGVTVLFASFIVPKAAQQLEEQCKERDPALWAEYEAKLDEGQRMIDRPDLMQELGNKVNAMIQAEVVTAMDAKDAGDGIIDAEVVKDSDEQWGD